MPMINDRSKVANVLAAVRSIKSKAQEMQGLPGPTVSMKQIQDSIQQMSAAYLQTVKPFIDTYTAPQVQTATERTVGLTAVPPNIRVLLVAVGSALGAFSAAFAPIYAGLGNTTTFDQATGQFVPIAPTTATFAALTTPLANIVAACTALDYED